MRSISSFLPKALPGTSVKSFLSAMDGYITHWMDRILRDSTPNEREVILSSCVWIHYVSDERPDQVILSREML